MKKSLIIAAGILYFVSTATNLNAQQVNAMPVSNVETSEPLTVKYLGSQEDYLIFRVEIKTGNVDHSVLKIGDATEGELYSNLINSNLKFQLVKIEKRENQVLDFTLLSGKKVYTKTFTTDSNDKLYQKGVAVL